MPPSRRDYYPLLLDLTGRRAVVVGGGRVAERKVRGLVRSSAEISVISPTLTPGLRRLAMARKIRHLRRSWRPGDLHGTWLVYAATDDREVNHTIATQARRLGCLVNVATRPDAGNVVVPSVVRRGDLVIAISTGGVSPALARQIRRDLSVQFGPEYRAFLALLGRARRLLSRQVRSEAQRRSILRRLVASDLLVLLRRGETVRAERRVRQLTGLRLSRHGL